MASWTVIGVVTVIYLNTPANFNLPYLNLTIILHLLIPRTPQAFTEDLCDTILSQKYISIGYEPNEFTTTKKSSKGQSLQSAIKRLVSLVPPLLRFDEKISFLPSGLNIGNASKNPSNVICSSPLPSTFIKNKLNGMPFSDMWLDENMIFSPHSSSLWSQRVRTLALLEMPLNQS